MPKYIAKIKDRMGNRKTITRTAESKTELISSLRAEGSIVLAVDIDADSNDLQNYKKPPFWHPSWLKPVTGFDVEMGFRQLASMLKSGVSLLSALQTVASQARHPRAARLWNAVYSDICSGKSLSDALEARRKTFGGISVQLVRVGEHSGELDASLNGAADQLESRRNLRMMVMNALAYPALATLMAVGVSAYLVVAVIPKIAEFLEQGGATLPAMTQMLVDLSGWLKLNGMSIVYSLAAVIAFVFVVRSFPRSREIFDLCMLKIPVTGHILRLSETAVFSKAMSLLLNSGVSLLESLSVTKSLLSNARLSRRVGDAYDHVMRGSSLADALYPAREFMPMLPRMAAVGETTGSLGDSFAEVARFHELTLSITIKRFSVTIEPVMILVTAGIVGFVYISFFMALFSMAGAA